MEIFAYKVETNLGILLETNSLSQVIVAIKTLIKTRFAYILQTQHITPPNEYKILLDQSENNFSYVFNSQLYETSQKIEDINFIHGDYFDYKEYRHEIADELLKEFNNDLPCEYFHKLVGDDGSEIELPYFEYFELTDDVTKIQHYPERDELFELVYKHNNSNKRTVISHMLTYSGSINGCFYSDWNKDFEKVKVTTVLKKGVQYKISLVDKRDNTSYSFNYSDRTRFGVLVCFINSFFERIKDARKRK